MIRVVCYTLLLAPIVGVIGQVVLDPHGWTAWREFARLRSLASTSLLLALLTILFAVPLGTLLGILLERGAIVGRSAARGLMLVGLFMPLSVTAVAWQIVLGTWFPPLALDPGSIAWRPWNQGVVPAAIVHAAAAIPWVTWLTALSLRVTDRTLEELAVLEGGPRRLVLWVWVPRLRLAMLAATTWVLVQTLTEIVVTDSMMVRTFAEEVYTQLVGFPSGVAGAVALTAPVWLMAIATAVPITRWLAGRMPPLRILAPPITVPLSRSTRIQLSLLTWMGIVAVIGLPVVALIWKTGRTADGWSVVDLVKQLERIVTIHGVVISSSVLIAAATGVVTVGLTLVLSWPVRHTRRGQSLLVLVAIVLWVTPSPLVGFGLKEVIHILLNLEEQVLPESIAPVRSMLYDQPSPLPGGWAAMVRFVPVALAMILPTMRAIPREIYEQAALDGVSVWRWVGWPQLRTTVTAAIVVVSVLALGEVGASKLVTPPHLRIYIVELFNQMHYGPEASVAAMALVQLVVTAIGVGLLTHVNRNSLHQPDEKKRGQRGEEGSHEGRNNQ